MSSSPSIQFRDSLKEVDQLLEIHTQLTGTGPGRRHKVEVLNKSAILFMCASFEAFIEVLATQAFSHVVADSKDHSTLPKPILRAIADALKSDKNELKVWDLAGTGWKMVCESYKNAVISRHIGPFNTPKPHNIEVLIKELVGLADLPHCWKWQGMSPSSASTKLKEFVELRGALAHGAKPPPTVTKRDVISYLNFLAPLSVRSSNHVGDYCHKITGKSPWPISYYNSVQ